MLMDFHCIEVLLGLPECRVIHQVLGPQQLGVVSRTPRPPHRVSPMWDLLFPREGKPTSVPPRLAHPGVPRHAMVASAAF